MEIRETSFLLDFYTRKNGKIRGLLKGARTPEPQFGALYEPYTWDHVVFYEKKNSEIFLISQCDLIDYFPGLRDDLERITYATYYTELVDAMCGMGEKNEDIFEASLFALRSLSLGSDPALCTRILEIKLLKYTGLIPGLKQCVNCGDQCLNENAKFSVSQGGVLCPDCAGNTPGARRVFSGTIGFIDAVSEMPLDKIQRINMSPEVSLDVAALIKNFLNFHIQRQFKSVKFMEQVGLK